ncbi:MAG: hypothetical protein RI948_430 [Bacteroidota bacterium]|jgi:hypothetical protein
MKIRLLVTQFESGFASSFTNTARVQYDVDFCSSTISDIKAKLEILKERVISGKKNEIKVGWEMSLEHIIMLQTTLEQLVDKYEEFFFIRPLDYKIYHVYDKLREYDIPSPKDIATDVIKIVFKPEKNKKTSKSEQIKADADAISLRRALKAYKKF